MKTIVFGEVIWDIYPDEALLGGAPLNFCAHLSRLGDTAYLISAVSETDDFGARTLAALKRYGIRDDLMQQNPAPTGRCNVTLDANKIPCYAIATGSAHDSLTVTEADLLAIRNVGAEIFYFNTLIQRNKISRTTLETVLRECRFRDIFCDINLRKNCYDRESLSRCLTHATYFKLSDEEIGTLNVLDLLPAASTPETVPELLCREYPNIRYAILTLGKNGSAVYDAGAGQLYRSGRPEKVPVVSTVGSGDCYGATFLHGLSGKMTFQPSPTGIKANRTAPICRFPHVQTDIPAEEAPPAHGLPSLQPFFPGSRTVCKKCFFSPRNAKKTLDRRRSRMV